MAAVFLAGLLLAGRGEAEETIQRFDSLITVHSDGSLLVHETITASAEGAQIRHGIRRDFRSSTEIG